MFGSSSTTTTVPFSVLTLLASHLLPLEQPHVAASLHNPHGPHPTLMASQNLWNLTCPPGGEDANATGQHPCRSRGTDVRSVGNAASSGRARRAASAAVPRRPLPPAAAGATTTTTARATAARAPSRRPCPGIQAEAASAVTNRVDDSQQGHRPHRNRKNLGGGQAPLVPICGPISNRSNSRNTSSPPILPSIRHSGTSRHLLRVPRVPPRPSRGTVAVRVDQATPPDPGAHGPPRKARNRVPRTRAATRAPRRGPERSRSPQPPRDAWSRLDLAGLHAGPVEREQRPAVSGIVIGLDGRERNP